MNTPFQTRTIQEAIETLIDYRGKTPPKTTSGVWLVTAKVIKEGFIQNEKKEYIAADFYDEWMRRGLPQQWDVLVTTEAPLGEIAQVRTAEKIALAQRVILLRGNPDVVHQGFLYQAMKCPFVQGELKARSSGTTVLGIKQSELWKVRIPWFPVPTQRKIAAILSAYDDLIENNTRRIAILESMAQAIYREWFVEFRFPGHENVKLVDSSLGKIPEGWKVGTLDDCCDFQEGYVNPSQKHSEYFGDDIKWLRAVDLNNSFVFDTTRRLSQAGFDSAGKSKLLFEPDTLAISKSGTIGRIGILKDNMCGNRAVINIKPKRNVCCNQFIFYTLLEYNREIVQLATGSVQKNLYVSVLGAQKIVIPSSDILKEFGQLISPFAEQIAIHQRQSTTLKATRDLLLPKLISGQLDVEDLDIETVTE